MELTAAAREELRDRINRIEKDIDRGSYRPGPWEAALKTARLLPRAERAALADEISRVSRKLHLRSGRRTIPAATGLGLEIAAALAGAGLLLVGAERHSNLLVILAALIWTLTFQPIIKIAVGYLTGVNYDYAYLWGVEPRFKMSHGDYVAAPRWARIVLHLSGMIGSPLGAWLPAICVTGDLWVAIDVCRTVFWLTVAINVAPFLAVLFGARRAGRFRLALSSGGSAAQELREALEI